MDRSWMYENRTTSEYVQGVQGFIQYAEENRSKKAEDFIVCPCCDCKNLRRYRNSDEVKAHLIRRGFKEGYNRWIWHGESLLPSTSASIPSTSASKETHINSDETHAANSESQANSQTHEDNDDEDNDDDDEDNDRIDEMMRDVQEDFSEMPPELKSFFENAEKPLFPGSTKVTKLSAVLKLYNLKAKNGWSDKGFTELLELLKDMLPGDNELPNSTYEAKKMLCPLGMDIERIHACPNDCILYWKEYKDLHVCPKCGASRYKNKDSCGNKKGPPVKVLWYLPAPFVSYIGTLVRTQVDINIKSWRVVDEALKNIIWTDVKNQFGIQDVSKKSVVLKIAWLRWKDFKSRLLRDYVHNKHPRYNSPSEAYEFISEEQWTKFVAATQTKEFKERSKKAREKQALNMHPHLLGSGGYARKQQEWMKSDPLSSQSSCASVSSSIISDDRSFDWLRARTKKSDDGSYFIPNEKTKEVLHKIVEKCEEMNQGTFEPKRHHDILSAVLGKEDHPGSVRGVGSYSTIQGVFGRPDRKQSTSSGMYTADDVKKMIDKCRQDTIMEVEAKMQPKINSMDQQLQFLMKNMSGTHLFSQGISAGTPQSVYAPYDPPICDPPPTRSSCHSVDTYPVTTIKSPKKCSLSVCPDGTPFVVAKGMAYPSTDGIMVHHKPLFPNCVKVWVDEVIDGGDRFNLPIPTQEFVTVADIVGNFAQWPVHLVILDENLSKEKKKMKDESCDLSATGTRPPIVDDDALKHLGDNCKYLVSLLTSVPLDKDYIDLEIDKSIFHHQNTTSIFVSMDDIKDLFTMNWLSVSIIQVFILFVHQLCNEFQVTSIGFACPTQISKDMHKRNVPSVTKYFINVMEQNKDKEFILAPYHADSHWLLLVISIRKRRVYVLDPLPCNRDIAEVKASLNLAFRSVPTNGWSKTINWIQCKCPIQPGGVECGYYVMRYMFDIVTKYSTVDRLDGAFESNRPYSMDDINEIRDQWAKYFYSQCV